MLGLILVKEIGIYYLGYGLKTSQKNFENILNVFTKPVRGKAGEFRRKNLNDLWDMAKNYDKTIKAKIKDAASKNIDSAAFLEDVWLQNREILRDLLKKEAERLGVDARGSFNDMADFFTINNEITRIARKTKASGGVIQETVKDVARKALPFAVGGGALGLAR